MNGEDGTHLVDTAELEVASKVLLVQCLHAGVEQATKKGALNLLYDFCSCLLRVVLCDDGAESVIVHAVLLRELVGRALDETQFSCGDAKRGEDADENVFVVFCAVSYELERCLEVVQEGMYVYWAIGPH